MRKILLAIMIGVFMAPGTVVAQQTKSAKLCSAVIPDHWRDTIIMPEDGNMVMCQVFVTSVGAHYTQLGCTDRFGVNWGQMVDGGVRRVPDSGFPKPNDCNWQND
jgi:hypothetical protein